MADPRGQLLSIFRDRGEPAQPDDGPDAEREAPESPLPVPPAQEMAPQDKAAALLSHAGRAVRHRATELRKREGGIWHAIRTYDPPSLDQHADYAKNRAWVPRGHEGGAIDRSGTAYHAAVKPALFVLIAAIWLLVRPLRALIAFTAAWLLAVIAAWILGVHALAVLMLIAHPGLPALAFVIVKAGHSTPEED